MKRILRNIALALVTGYVFFYFGERFFWSFLHPGDTLISNVLAWFLYSFAAYATLIIIAALIYNSGLALPTNFAVLYITIALGFIILGISLYKAFRGPKDTIKTTSL